MYRTSTPLSRPRQALQLIAIATEVTFSEATVGSLKCLAMQVEVVISNTRLLMDFSFFSFCAHCVR
jgi:hypothetical protein